MPIRVALADDHVLVRQGLKSLLEREEVKVVAEAADGQEAVTQAVSLHPDIAIMDISMPMLNGIDAARELGRACPKTKVILLTQHEEDQYILEALEAGVKGYVLKSLIAEGKSTKDVASLLDISVKTAESHRSRLMRKLDIHETASLVRYAVRRGLVQP